ncbi:hypothetical protein L484_018039 [Morus notabilis]|uniref:Uncharacterized protein n=1 Tax=Morus notabilis TaxID=981085 RepID=W9RRR0_9ROSA|nr:hypothetical protein L484_018039 [Morus notabilis]
MPSTVRRNVGHAPSISLLSIFPLSLSPSTPSLSSGQTAAMLPRERRSTKLWSLASSLLQGGASNNGPLEPKLPLKGGKSSSPPPTRAHQQWRTQHRHRIFFRNVESGIEIFRERFRGCSLYFVESGPAVAEKDRLQGERSASLPPIPKHSPAFSASKLKSLLPPSSNLLKRNQTMETVPENSIIGICESGVQGSWILPQHFLLSRFNLVYDCIHPAYKIS